MSDFAYPGKTGHERYVQCDCGHKSYGDFFGSVWTNNPKDAWAQHKLHMDSDCQERRRPRTDSRQLRLEEALAEIRKILDRVTS